MPIIIKSDDEIAIMREAGRIVARTMQMLVDALRPGLVVKDLDKLVRSEFKKTGVIPTFLGYAHPPYPATVCVSVNEEIVHGIPGKRVIQDGDVVSLDLGCTYKGFVADHAVTVLVGEGTPEKRKLVDVTKQALCVGIQHLRPGRRLGEVSHAIQTYIEGEGFGVVREYCGHGVGRSMHEEPQVPNYGSPESGPLLKKGMVVAIEPMVNLGRPDVEFGDSSRWVVVTKDRKCAAHFEHTVAVLENGVDVLTDGR